MLSDDMLQQSKCIMLKMLPPCTYRVAALPLLNRFLLLLFQEEASGPLLAVQTMDRLIYQ